MNKNFYYKGKFFEDENDFFLYVNEWPKTNLSEESLSEMLILLKKDILVNIQEGLVIKNGDMEKLLQETFLKSMVLRKND
mgnify:CR=1 FL=1